MIMLNIIGRMKDIDYVTRELVLLECMHTVNAMREIDNNNFTVSTTEKHMNALVDINFIKPYHGGSDFAKTAEQIEKLMDAFNLDREVKRQHISSHFDFADTVSTVDEISNLASGCLQEEQELMLQLSHNREMRQYFGYIQEIDIPWEKLRGMEYFNFKVGMFPKENMDKLKNNYDNIPAIVYRVNSLQSNDVVITIAPKSLSVELDRIYSSLNYQTLNLPDDLEGTPGEIIKRLEDEENDIIRRIDECREQVYAIGREYGSMIEESYSRLKTYEKMQEICRETACSDEFFYMAGWVPASIRPVLEERLKDIEEHTILVYKDPEQVGKKITPPTRLKNMLLVRPFEALVNMYGTPSYKELDPTSFVGISYMLLFGIMFGDVGQGLLFLIAGLFLSHKKSRPNMGGVISRLGISSMLFGTLYGSVFGFENLIPALLIRPMANINTMLTAAIVIGVLLLSVAFVYSLINAFRQKNLEEGLLGRNGVVGLLFFWTLLITALLYLQSGRLPLPLPVIILILAFLLGLMVVRQPLANWLMKKKPLYEEPVADYYIEEGFGLLETLLSILSNTISFVRVGAFALNHVGLFVAFETMSEMMHNAAESVLILIIGNVVIIGLEGLIVFIQGLRLEYYELFSKFYDGSGIPYNPVAVNFRRLRKKEPDAGRASRV